MNRIAHVLHIIRKRITADPVIQTEESPPHGASRGQVLIMFAVMSTSLLGMLGLATDLGFMFQSERAVQAAADAGALAGARQIAKWTSDNQTSAWNEVKTIVESNDFGSLTPSIKECNYINDSNSNVGSNCGATVPASATGVRVMTEAASPTFFMRIFPGIPKTLPVLGSASARVQMADLSGYANGPFVVCGTKTKLADGVEEFSILKPDDTIDPNAYGKTYEIHSSQVEDCDAPTSKFKGLAAEEKNKNLQIGQLWWADNGNKVGPTNQKVNGIEGCQDNLTNCVVLLPIFDNFPPPVKVGGNDGDLLVIVRAIAAFKLSDCKSPCQHVGTLLKTYHVNGPGSNGWTRGNGGVITIRLNW